MKIDHYFNLFLVLLVFSTATCSILRGEEPHMISNEYRGFHVDYSEVRNEPNFETLRAAMNKQIDMVLAVGVPDRMRSFFQQVPLKVRAGQESYAGHYTGKRGKAVELTSGFLSTGRKPALLHEFLHAYHDQRMAGGFKNRDVLMYFERAKAINAYDSGSHMMTNAKEYFASAGTAYLFGETRLEPFQREKVERSQPQFYQFLSSLFGPDAGQYQGSLDR